MLKGAESAEHYERQADGVTLLKVAGPRFQIYEPRRDLGTDHGYFRKPRTKFQGMPRRKDTRCML